MERQTLRRLPRGDIAFGIRVHQRPLRALQVQAGALDVLDAAMCNLAGSPSGEKKLGRLAVPVRNWLEAERSRAARR